MAKMNAQQARGRPGRRGAAAAPRAQRLRGRERSRHRSPAPSRRWSRKRRPTTGRISPISIRRGRTRRACRRSITSRRPIRLVEAGAGRLHSGRGGSAVHVGARGHGRATSSSSCTPTARRRSSGSVFVGYAFAEGWAHYAEEMMWEAGLRQRRSGDAYRPALQRAAARLPLSSRRSACTRAA